MEKLKVIFRKIDSIDSEIVAFFPELPANTTCIMSYMHVGQHSEASMGFYHTTKTATKEEYMPLLEEPKRVYDDCELVVRQRMNYHDLMEKAWNKAWKY